MKLSKLFSAFLLLFLLSGMSGCTGDDKTIVETVEKIICWNGDEVTDRAECPVQPVTPPPVTPPDDDDDTDTGRSDCDINVQGANLKGTTQDDVICGNDKDNMIEGLTGDDIIYGGAGNDTLIGGNDRDTLKGEAGNDILRGGEDNDIFDGGDGTDTADYSKEQLNADGDALAGGASPVEVNLVTGETTDTYGDNDSLISIENVIGTFGNDTITGDKGNNEIDGNGGTADNLDGGAGSDTIVVVAGFNLASDQEADDTIKNFENIRARGSGTGLLLTGNNGSNKITANDGGATLTGGDGNDELIGGKGIDKLIGGKGKDTLTGGGGNDCFQFDADLSGITGSTANSKVAAVISSTVDKITDYEAGDSIYVNITNLPTDAGQVTSAVEKGKVVVSIAAVPADTTANPPIVAQSARTATIATGTKDATSRTEGTCP